MGVSWGAVLVYILCSKANIFRATFSLGCKKKKEEKKKEFRILIH